MENEKMKELADGLIAKIKSNPDPFDTYTIIVPNLITEQWFKSYWIRQGADVLFNVRFTRLVSFLNEAYNKGGKKLMSSEERTLFIVDILRHNKPSDDYIKKYYDNNTVNLYDLSEKLSAVFSVYEEEGTEITGWEKNLYDELNKIPGYASIRSILSGEPSFKGKVFLFGFTEIGNAYLDALKKLDTTFFMLKEKETFSPVKSLTAAASREREVEYVHDEISKILKDDRYAKYSDILVYMPDVSLYEGCIRKVFSIGEDKRFPEIRYVILGSHDGMSSTASALNLLYTVLLRNQFTRTDFYKLISNPSVIRSRGINSSSINDIIDALDAMNVYRNNEKCDEWMYGLRRLLVSKLIGGSSADDNHADIDGKSYYPYSSIGLNDAALVMISEILDDVISFRNAFKDKVPHVPADSKNPEPVLEPSDLDILKVELDKWLSVPEANDEESNFYYKAALKILDFVRDNKKTLPSDVLFASMIHAAGNVSAYPSDMLTGGVTFLKFDEKNIIPAKYVFFMGMSSDALPRKYIENELDSRDKDVKEKNGITAKDHKTLHYLRANAENEYFSYVNQNLKTMEEYEPSSLFEVDKSIETTKLTLSEKRGYADLYSKTEFRKKEYAISLIKKDAASADADNTSEEGKKEKITEQEVDSSAFVTIKHTELSDFITEGFMAKMKRIISERKDSALNASKTYEPIKLDNLLGASVRKDILRGLTDKVTISSLTPVEVMKHHDALHDFPYMMRDNAKKALIDQVEGFVNKLPLTYKVGTPFDLPFDDWILSVNAEYIHALYGGALWIYEFNSKDFDEDKPSQFAKAYIISLAHLVKEYGDKDDNELLVLLNGHEDITFKVTPKDAAVILNNLYHKYMDYTDMKIWPLDQLHADKYESVIFTLDNGAWMYFEDGKMFDKEEMAGYDRNNFKDTWDDFADFVTDNILYVH